MRPAHEILALIAYAQKPEVSNETRGLIFGLTFLYFHTLCMREAKSLEANALVSLSGPEHMPRLI